MNLKESLVAALNQLGADAGRFQFDDHSTIAMSFDDVGEIYLDPKPAERLWLWGVIEPVTLPSQPALAAALLDELLRPVTYWESGGMVVRADGRVGGLLEPECVANPDQLAVALQDFHQCLLRLQCIK